MRRLSRGLTASISVVVGAAFVIVPTCTAQATDPDSKDTGGTANRALPASLVPQPYYHPMTGKERLQNYFTSTFNPMAVVRSAASAGIGQWRDKPKEWPLGRRGFAARYLSSYAERVTESTLELGLSSAFQEDNRYLPSHRDTVGGRLAYAIPSPFLARRTDGTRRISFSKLSAVAGAAFIARLWQPHSSRRVSSALVNIGASFGAGTGFDVLREFWPRRQ